MRFSDPGAVATGWDETRRVIETAELFWISTVRGRRSTPRHSARCRVARRRHPHFATGATEQKAINLRDNPHVILTTGCNHWDEGLDVVVEGNAVRLTNDDVLKRLAETWATKWDGRWHYEARNGAFHHEGGGEALVLAVPWIAWGRGMREITCQGAGFASGHSRRSRTMSGDGLRTLNLRGSRAWRELPLRW
jgi:hypothetical protein